MHEDVAGHAAEQQAIKSIEAAGSVTIRSAPCSSAAARISRAGSPPRTWGVVGVPITAANAATVQARILAEAANGPVRPDAHPGG